MVEFFYQSFNLLGFFVSHYDARNSHYSTVQKVYSYQSKLMPQAKSEFFIQSPQFLFRHLFFPVRTQSIFPQGLHAE